MRIDPDLAHYVLFIVKQWVAKAADIFPLKFHIKRVHHELAHALGGAADDAFMRPSFITRTGAVLRAFGHRHFAIDFYRFGPFAGVGIFANVRVGNRHHRWAALRFTHVRKYGTQPAAPFVRYAPCIAKCGLCHYLFLI